VYGYDDLGQVTSGKRYWSDGTPVAGQQFDYAFDHIGNRDSATVNGHTADYTANELNQYTSREVPGFAGVSGSAHSDAKVTLWGDNSSFTPTSRKGEYFFGELAVTNTNALVWLTITNIAVLNTATNDIITNSIGRALVAKTPEVFGYDLEGNQTNDSLWNRAWNAENRMISVESTASVPDAARAKETWTHLPDGRWIERVVSVWNENTLNYQPSTTNRFLWDGQALLAVLDHTNGVVMSFLRGLDLSGSVQGAGLPAIASATAGGVGGVLAVNFAPSTLNPQLSTHLVSYDGNGNVIALLDAPSSQLSAQFEYGPFGEPIRVSGPAAHVMPLRFSTMYQDGVTGDLKYLFRDYDAGAGRWPSRDPVGESEGPSLYGFVLSDPVGGIDSLGRSVLSVRLFVEWLVGLNGWSGDVTYNHRSVRWQDFDNDGSTAELLKHQWAMQNRATTRSLCRRTIPNETRVFEFAGIGVESSFFNSNEPWISAYRASAALLPVHQRITVSRDNSCCCEFLVTLQLSARDRSDFNPGERFGPLDLVRDDWLIGVRDHTAFGFDYTLGSTEVVNLSWKDCLK
jgi:RHS repeat-associated protein